MQDPAPSAQPRPRARLVAIVALVALALAVFYIIMLQSMYFGLRSDSSRTIEAHVKTIIVQNQQIEALDQLAVRVAKFNKEFGAEVGLVRLDDSLNSNVGDLEKKATAPDQAKKTLAELEETITAIRGMTTKLKEYERFLGQPVAVKRGDSHAAIARRYLVDEAKLSPKEADAVLRKTALAWELDPGNQVFNLYHDGLLFTTVTQGAARRPPLLAQLSQRQASAARVQELEEKIHALEARVVSGESTSPAPSAAELPPTTAPVTPTPAATAEPAKPQVP
jgi:hypothetical protein